LGSPLSFKEHRLQTRRWKAGNYFKKQRLFSCF